MTEPRAAFQDDDTQTDVQPNETDPVPASEDAPANAEAPPPETDSELSTPPDAESVSPGLAVLTVQEGEELSACAVCRQSIEPGADYVTAAYGPVHAEPCSHQTRPGLV